MVGKEEFIERMTKEEGISQTTAKKVYEIFTRTMGKYLKERKTVNIFRLFTISIEIKPHRKEMDSKYKLKETKAYLRISNLITNDWD